MHGATTEWKESTVFAKATGSIANVKWKMTAKDERGRRWKERGGGKEGKGQVQGRGEVRTIYQNVNRGETAAPLLLQLAVGKEAAVVAVVEPWGRRKQPAGYETSSGAVRWR